MGAWMNVGTDIQTEHFKRVNQGCRPNVELFLCEH